MASTITRRPLPALVSLLALLALTAIVWWRVLNRDTAHSTAAKPTPTPCPTVAAATTTLAPPQAVLVMVLNATNRGGIASRARTTLIADGFSVPHQAANDKASVSIKTTAEIRFGPAGVDAAQLLRYYFPGSTLKRIKTHSHGVTVSLGNRYTAVASAKAVKAALAKDRIALGAAPSPTPGSSPSPGSSASSTRSGSAAASPSAASC